MLNLAKSILGLRISKAQAGLDSQVYHLKPFKTMCARAESMSQTSLGVGMMKKQHVPAGQAEMLTGNIFIWEEWACRPATAFERQMHHVNRGWVGKRSRAAGTFAVNATRPVPHVCMLAESREGSLR